MSPPSAAVASTSGGGLVSRPSVAYFLACTAGLGLGAARTYYDLLDVGVPFKVLGELHNAAAAAAAASGGGAAGALRSTAGGGGANLAGAAAASAAASSVLAADPPTALRWLSQPLPPLPLPFPLPAPAVVGGIVSDARLIGTRMLQSELGLFVALNWLVSVYCLAALLTTVRSPFSFAVLWRFIRSYCFDLELDVASSAAGLACDLRTPWHLHLRPTPPPPRGPPTTTEDLPGHPLPPRGESSHGAPGQVCGVQGRVCRRCAGAQPI